MDVHRCRFVAYNPQAINALAFSHPPSAELHGRGVPTLRLAIGRANGDIEIWNPLRGLWFQELILRGGKDRSIEGLVWTLDPGDGDDNGPSGAKVPGKLRLFSIGYSSVVTEWDLEQGRPARHSSGNYSEIWCLAAQPRWEAPRKGKGGKILPPSEGKYTGQHLAAGCADGSVVILSTEDGDLKYLRTMRPSTKKARVLSIAFQDRNMVVVGYADSFIRVFDLRIGRISRTISLGTGPAKGSKELLVWAVKCLPDGTIVSGDSAGEVRFWDAKNYSLIQRILGHQADILDIAVSADGESVISGGADQRTTLYRRKPSEKGDKARRWVEVTHRRYHTHDVKAFAVYETKDISVVVSGGLDTTPVVVPLREYANEHHRKLSSLPQVPQLSSSTLSRLLMSWWDREVNIWHVSPRPGFRDYPHDGRRHRLVAKVLLQGEENLSSAALSPDGSFLVAATLSEVKLFSLTRRKGEAGFALRVRKLDTPSEVSKNGAKVVAISPDSRWLFLIRPNNDIYSARVETGPCANERLRVLPDLIKLNRVSRHVRHEKHHHGTLGGYERSIRCVAFSEDSRIVATGDLAGCIDTWVLKDHETSEKGTEISKINGETSSSSSDDDSSVDEPSPVTSQGQRWIPTSADSPIPRLPSGILLLTFHPPAHPRSRALANGVNIHHSSPKLHSGSDNLPFCDDRLMVLTTEHQLVEFNIFKGKLSDWSRRNPKAYLPAGFRAIKDRAMGALWDISHGRDRLWLYGPSWMWMFDISQDFPSESACDPKVSAMPNGKVTKKGSSSFKKRKREDDEEQCEGPNSGAGDRMPLSESGVRLGSKIRKTTGEDASVAEWISLDERARRKRRRQDDLTNENGGEESDDEVMSASDSALARLRRQQLQDSSASEDDDAEADNKDNKLTNGTNAFTPSDKDSVSFAVVIENKVGKQNKRKDKRHASNAGDEMQVVQPADADLDPTPNRRWWHTYKYREVLGIVPLGSPIGSEGHDHIAEGVDVRKKSVGLEVAVVERPIWDVELPSRYIRDYE